MNFNFELILFYAVLVTGLIALFDIVFLAKKRKSKKMPVIIDYARAFFPVLLLVFFLRSFLYEGFRIPSGSLKPTLLVGDFIAVNKFDYGIRLPVIHKTIYKRGEPKRGDIFVFRFPPNPSIYYIKRVIGVPGDRISYINKVLYVNGEKIPQEFVKNSTDFDAETNNSWDTIEKEENLLGVKHAIFEIPDRSSMNFEDIIVPRGMYFAMGDNRDDSEDSRFWGFVPEENIVGKASTIVISWNAQASWLTPWDKFRWERIWKKVH